MTSSDTEAGRSARDPTDDRIALIADAGTGVLRYGVVFLLVVIGATKYFAFEAEGIRPLVEHSPFLSWMPGAFGVQGTSDLIGTFEILTGLAIASRRFTPALSAAGSAAGVVIFLTTLSFLFSTPGALAPGNPAGGFLMKDVVLLGACIATAAEALAAARARRSRRTAPPLSIPASRSA